MQDRITRKTLESMAGQLNKITGSPDESYTKEPSGKLRANPGNYHITGAYGGHNLCRMCNNGGGCEDVFFHGHVTARQLYNEMRAFLVGFEAAKGGN